MTAFSRHSPLSVQFAELRQLQGGIVVFGFCLLPRSFVVAPPSTESMLPQFPESQLQLHAQYGYNYFQPPQNFSVTSRSQKPLSLLATAATQRTAHSMENAAKMLSFTKPRSHLMAPPNIILGATKRNSRPVVIITPTLQISREKKCDRTLKSSLEW